MWEQVLARQRVGGAERERLQAAPWVCVDAELSFHGRLLPPFTRLYC